MPATLTPTDLIFGADAPEITTIDNLPLNTLSVRLRFRPKSFAVAYVVTPLGITAYTLKQNGDKLSLAFPIGENRRADNIKVSLRAWKIV